MRKSRRMAIVLIGLLMAITACGASHTHTFSPDWSKDAEYHWHAATCEHKDQVSEKAPHTWSEGVVKTPATCHSEGVKEYTCTVCGQTKQEVIQKLDHTWSTSWSKDATYHWKVCTSDGCSETTTKEAHKWDAGTVIVEPTCHSKGVKEFSCTVCGQTKREDISEKAHEWETNWTTNETHHWKKCSDPQCSKINEAAEHSWDAGTVITPGTCQTKEVKRFECQVCNYTKEVVGEYGDHAWSTTYEHDDDQHWHVCTVPNCGLLSTKENHAWGEGEITVTPSYTQDGERTYTCVCGVQKTEVIHMFEQATKPEALVQKDDYALETFGDPEVKTLSYDAADVSYHDGLTSYAWKYATTGSKQTYLNFPDTYLSAGLFDVEFDYWADKVGSGFFYVELWCNDVQGDNVFKKVEGVTAGSKTHVKFEANFSGKTVTKSFLKIHSYQGEGEYEVYFDNFKLVKRGPIAYDEPLILASVDGGTFGYKYSTELGAETYNFVSNGENTYEKFYLKAKNGISAGKYRISFDYAFRAFNTNEMWIGAFEKSNPTAVFETRVANTGLNTKYSQEFTFTLTNDFDVIRIMTSNVPGIVDMSLNHFVIDVPPEEEPVVKPTSLDNVGEYALETFGDSTSKVLSYDSSKYDADKGSYVYRQEIAADAQIYINFDKAYTTNGYYQLEFDYWVENAGSGYFYVDLFCNDVQGDCQEIKVTDMTIGSKLHASLLCNFAGKTVTKNFLKFHAYQATEKAIVILDNVKLSRAENYDCPDAAGGSVQYVDNSVLGLKAYNIVSSGAAAYEPFYFKPLSGVSVPAGSYTLTFDYEFEQFDTNTLYISIYDTNDVNPTSEVNNFDTSLSAKHSYSITFTIDDSFLMFRIMTANQGVINMSICNIQITPSV